MYNKMDGDVVFVAFGKIRSKMLLIPLDCIVDGDQRDCIVHSTEYTTNPEVSSMKWNWEEKYCMCIL